MGDGAHEDEDAVEGERDEEEIEVSVVPLPHTVANPGAVVVEPLDTVVTDRAVAGSGGPEDFAGETELELDGLTFHLTIKIVIIALRNPCEGRLDPPESPWSWAGVCMPTPPHCRAVRSPSRYTRPRLWSPW